jgi:superfamily I DNA/RNA helicase
MLKWLMIDDFQDLYPLFFNLIKVLRKHNPELKLFCVGDDWLTAINGFARFRRGQRLLREKSE